MGTTVIEQQSKTKTKTKVLSACAMALPGVTTPFSNSVSHSATIYRGTEDTAERNTMFQKYHVTTKIPCFSSEAETNTMETNQQIRKKFTV